MAGMSYPFDSGPGSTISEDQWSFMMRDGVGTGVHEGLVPGPEGTELRVSSLAEPGIIYVAPGRATLAGFHYQQSGSEVIAVTANDHASNARIDAAVLRLDLESNTIALEAKLGVPSGTPVPPAISSNELLLATYRVRASTNSVLNNEVTDARAFIGRRVGVSNLANFGRQGDIYYSPGLDRFRGVIDGGFKESFAFEQDITNHANAADPHAGYALESAFSVSTSVLDASPNVTTFAGYCRGINLPGGFKIVHLYAFGAWGGADQSEVITLWTIREAALRPNFTIRVPGQQWEFANDTTYYPGVFMINPSGSIRAGDDTWLMGDSQFVFSVTYLVGPGV